MLDPPTGRLHYANAGHCPAYLRSGERVVELSSAGLPLGVSVNAAYADEVVHLAQGDCLIMYSDGVVETRAGSGELFGFDRLARLVAACTGETVLERVLQAIGRFRGSDALPEDDVTLVVVEHA